MVALVSTLVLAPTLVLLALFGLGWHYQFGTTPPLRATAVVAVAALWLVYAVVSLPELLSEPVASVIVVVAVLVLMGGIRHIRLRRRA